MFRKIKDNKIKVKNKKFEKNDYVQEIDILGEFDFRTDKEIRHENNLSSNEYIVDRGTMFYDLREERVLKGFRRYHQKKVDKFDFNLKEEVPWGEESVPEIKRSDFKKDESTLLNTNVKKEYVLKDLEQNFESEGYKVEKDYSFGEITEGEIESEMNQAEEYIDNNLSTKSIFERETFKPLGINNPVNQTFKHGLIVVKEYLNKALDDRAYTVSGLIKVVELIIANNLVTRVITDEEIRFFENLLITLSLIKRTADTFKTSHIGINYEIGKIVREIKREIHTLLN